MAAPAGNEGADLNVAFRSMASDIRFRVTEPSSTATEQASAARAVVERVATSCTRFDADSDLMRANAAGRHWSVVSRECYDAIAAAHDAYVRTDGLFDPRVLETLRSYGYGQSLPFESAGHTLQTQSVPVRWRPLRQRSWKPAFDRDRLAVRIGPEPIDLGGIGKGLAVRWAGEQLAGCGAAVLVEAGGDVLALGGGPDGDGWLIGVEDPLGGTEPVAVLRLTDRAVATSSIRIRSWVAGGSQVHHIIDPRTRRSAQSDLRAVTVVDPDPAYAEVWSKSLFIVGRPSIRREADERGLAALWVDVDGRVTTSRAMRDYVAWQVSHVA